MTEQLHFHFSLSCIGEGNGNPLQCSCLQNPRDGGAWWASVYGVAQSQTRLKQLSSSSSTGLLDSITPFELHFAVTLPGLIPWTCKCILASQVCHLAICEVPCSAGQGVGGVLVFFPIYSWLFCTTTTKRGLSNHDQCLCVASSRLLDREEKK